jgi:hypothetical protein
VTAAEDVAELYWSTFVPAPRYAAWTGGHWTPVAGRPSDAEIIAALAADGPPLSGFFLADDDTTHVLALDVDAEDWQAVMAVSSALGRCGIAAYPEHSRRGGHVWIVLDRPVPAVLGRRALQAALEAADLDPTDRHLELRPSTDRHTSEFAGGSLRLPWMPHPATGQRYGLLDPATGASLHPKIAGSLLAVRLADSSAVARLAEGYIPRRPITYPPARHEPREAGPGICAVLADRFGIEAAPGRRVRCPYHDDHSPSLKIALDDQRAWCWSHSCEANEDGRGITPWQAARLAGVA